MNIALKRNHDKKRRPQKSDLDFINQQRISKYMRSTRPVDAIEGWTHIGAAVRNIMSEIER